LTNYLRDAGGVPPALAQYFSKSQQNDLWNSLTDANSTQIHHNHHDENEITENQYLISGGGISVDSALLNTLFHYGIGCKTLSLQY
jgi:hypothetical protein